MNAAISILFCLILIGAGIVITRKFNLSVRRRTATIVGLTVFTIAAPIALIQLFGTDIQRNEPADRKVNRRPHQLKFTARISYVIDGDTVVLQDEERVRLVQIDAPESAGGRAECHGKESSKALTHLLPKSSKIIIETDPALGKRDRYGRILGWVFLDAMNVNQELVRSGDAAVWFYRGTRTKRSSMMLSAQRQAIKKRRGLWQMCKGTPVDANQGVDTGPPS